MSQPASKLPVQTCISKRVMSSVTLWVRLDSLSFHFTLANKSNEKVRGNMTFKIFFQACINKSAIFIA